MVHIHVTLVARQKMYFLMDPSPVRSIAIALHMYAAVLGIVKQSDHHDLIESIDTLYKDDGDVEFSGPELEPSPLPPIVIGGTRLAQWVLLDQCLEILRRENRVPPNVSVIVDHGRYSCDIFASDNERGQLSQGTQETIQTLMNEIIRARGGAAQGFSKVLSMRDRPLSYDPADSAATLVVRKLRGEVVPISFREDELRAVLGADITTNGLYATLNRLRPHMRRRYRVERTSTYLLTAHLLDSHDYDVREECEWFEKVFPELFTPGLDVVAQPTSRLAETGLFMRPRR